MKNRVISGVLIAILTVAAIYFGGPLYYTLLAFIALYGCYEIILLLDKKRFKYFLYISMLLFILGINVWRGRNVGLILVFIVVLFFLAVVDETTSLSDISACFLLAVILAFAIQGAINLHRINKWILLYLAITSFLSDVGAFFVGRSFGKRKLNERVSPNKTVEGAIGGWFVGFILSLIFAYICRFFGFAPWFIIANSIALPIVSELGDLSFSLVKRNYNVKDFSNLIPGHGGLLDRIDSLLLCLIFFSSMVSFL